MGRERETRSQTLPTLRNVRSPIIRRASEYAFSDYIRRYIGLRTKIEIGQGAITYRTHRESRVALRVVVARVIRRIVLVAGNEAFSADRDTGAAILLKALLRRAMT